MRYIKQTLKILGALVALVIMFFTSSVLTPLNSIAAEQDYVVQIGSAEELSAIAYVVNVGYVNSGKYYYLLTADIDFSDLEYEDGKGWQPIGYKTVEDSVAFAGVFDGAGYTIKGLWINTPDNTSGTGLFGYNTGTIKNLNVIIDESNGGINAEYYAGGIAGINEGRIENSTVSGKIIADYSGGICGINKGTISGCVNYADVSAFNGIGGITGSNAGTVISCQNAGKLNGSVIGSDIGGIAGYNAVGGANISECANYGTVSGRESIGGIIGRALNMEINNCANYGAVSGETSVGGIAGYSRAILQNSLNFASVSGEYETGGIAGSYYGIEIANCFYETNAVSRQINYSGDEQDGVDTLSVPVSANELITRRFLDTINNGGSKWVLPAPDDFHYYPELSALSSDYSKQYTKATVAVYKGTPVLSGQTLTYGELLSKLDFVQNNEGVFSWQEPDKILNAGDNVIAYVSFIPANDNYGELYDIEVVLTVNKAQSELTVIMEGWKDGTDAVNPVISITRGELSESEIIVEYKKKNAPDSEYSAVLVFKAGKYTVRVSYPESDNYLTGYAVYDFEIKPDLTWAFILTVVLGGLILIMLAVFLIDKKIRIFARIKKAIVSEEIVREVIIEKPVYIQPQLNTKALAEYHEQLTPKETEVAKKILEGKTRKEIAAELYISEATTKRHIESILQKTDCVNQKIFVIKFKI